MHKESIFMQGLAAHPPVHLLFMVSCPLPSHCMLTCSGRLELWTLRQMVLLGLCQPSVFIIMLLTVFPARVKARGWKWLFVCTVSHLVADLMMNPIQPLRGRDALLPLVSSVHQWLTPV